MFLLFGSICFETFLLLLPFLFLQGPKINPQMSKIMPRYPNIRVSLWCFLFFETLCIKIVAFKEGIGEQGLLPRTSSFKSRADFSEWFRCLYCRVFIWSSMLCQRRKQLIWRFLSWRTEFLSIVIPHSHLLVSLWLVRLLICICDWPVFRRLRYTENCSEVRVTGCGRSLKNWDVVLNFKRKLWWPIFSLSVLFAVVETPRLYAICVF